MDERIISIYKLSPPVKKDSYHRSRRSLLIGLARVGVVLEMSDLDCFDESDEFIFSGCVITKILVRNLGFGD